MTSRLSSSFLREKTETVASPTASLHFTKKLIKDLKKKLTAIINSCGNGGTFLQLKPKH